MSDKPDHSEVLGSWSLVSRIDDKQEFLGDVSIEKLQWDRWHDTSRDKREEPV